MRISAFIVFSIVLAPVGLIAQNPAFEVASVRPAATSGGRMEVNGMYTYPGGRVVCHGCTLEYLMMNAFDIQAFQISGGPEWIHDTRFEIEARPPATAKSSQAAPLSAKAAPNEEQRQMLQTLLADRFQLKARKDVTQGSVYVLTKNGKALKLDTAKDIGKSDFSWVGSPRGGMITGDGIAGENISMPILASRLSRYLTRPVLDQTGISGFFDFKYEYASDEQRPDVVSSILASIQGLGLKLEATKGPVETIVIDHVEKPSDN